MAVLCVVIMLLVIIVIQQIKIFNLRRSAREITEEIEEILNLNSNTLIDVSSRDKYILSLASKLNHELKTLRYKQLRYENGDKELKEAVTNISHDLRTPLTAIFGYLDLLESEEKSENAARYLSFIENRANAMKTLTEEMFRYSIILSSDNTSDTADVNLCSVLEESIASFYCALAEKGIEPEINIPNKPIIRKVSKRSLTRVFENIINNALKYSDGDLTIDLNENGEISLSNSAKNLDEVQTGRLFDRFFTVRENRSSTGLGLAIAKTLVEQMGGTIGAKYSDGKITITVTFI